MDYSRRFRQLLERLGQDNRELETEQRLGAGQNHTRLGQHLFYLRMKRRA
jgi:hypothetical protein